MQKVFLCLSTSLGPRRPTVTSPLGPTTSVRKIGRVDEEPDHPPEPFFGETNDRVTCLECPKPNN